MVQIMSIANQCDFQKCMYVITYVFFLSKLFNFLVINEEGLLWLHKYFVNPS